MPFHNGQIAEDVEHLMRSRYSAYTLGLADYIIKTTYPAVRPKDLQKWRLEILDFGKLDFIGLKIESKSQESLEGKVSFVAQIGSGEMSEESLFLKQDGVWYYHSGINP